MADISAALVKELRDETNVGMMECKRALVEAAGDKVKALKILRERGLAIAAKKASRAANQGVIASAIAPQGKAGSLIEVNSETDFVAKNENFLAFTKKLAGKALELDGSLADAAQAEVTAKIAEIGENLVVRRNLRYVCQGNGLVASYIHHGSAIGVLLEAGCDKPETASNPKFLELVKDITLHVAASSPRFLDRGNVPADVIAAERDIYANQVQNKPANIVQKIVDGKMNKFYEQTCLVDQPFVKDQDTSAAKLLKALGAELGDTLTIRRFARFQVGEQI
ncbi:MAG: translation elongation factor Ts [Lentisphaerae bacterium]|nr:translation elongation factor Ts [Lentisphaerota bacterium]